MTEANKRLLMKVIRDLQRGGYHDEALADALRTECAHLRIPYTAEDFIDAIQIVAAADLAHMERPIAPRIDPPEVIEGSRTLEELDDLAPNDPERDEICKRLSREDQARLMARYGR